MSRVYNKNPKFEIVKESRDWREKITIAIMETLGI